jgi:pimeloyl-ACP methyl ester carboxylesterase
LTRWSDHPATGYNPQRRAADILEVIGALGMQKPILVGNSCGGGILHSLGAEHAERVSGLVYLDAAEDPTLNLSDSKPTLFAKCERSLPR